MTRVFETRPGAVRHTEPSRRAARRPPNRGTSSGGAVPAGPTMTWAPRPGARPRQAGTLQHPADVASRGACHLVTNIDHIPKTPAPRVPVPLPGGRVAHGHLHARRQDTDGRWWYEVSLSMPAAAVHPQD